MGNPGLKKRGETMVVAFGARKKPRLFRAEQVAEETLIGSGADPSLVPCAISVGMVLIW